MEVYRLSMQERKRRGLVALVGTKDGQGDEETGKMRPIIGWRNDQSFSCVSVGT